MSSVISNPAMLAVIKVTKVAAKNALTTTLVIEGLRSGAKADKPPTMIPIDEGFAKLQIAYVAMAAERS